MALTVPWSVASRRRLIGRAALVAAVVVALLSVAPAGPGVVEAQDACLTDLEPNDEPAAAVPFVGAGCAVGTLPGQDKQDLYLWTLSGADAAAFWRLSLTGIPGAATSLQVLPIISAPGAMPPEMGSPVMRLDAPPETLEPLASSDLLLPPGD